MAKSDRKGATQGSVGDASKYKVAILKALSTLQDCHPQGSELWALIDKAKTEIQNETNEDILKAKGAILYEEFKKELGEAVTVK